MDLLTVDQAIEKSQALCLMLGGGFNPSIYRDYEVEDKEAWSYHAQVITGAGTLEVFEMPYGQYLVQITGGRNCPMQYEVYCSNAKEGIATLLSRALSDAQKRTQLVMSLLEATNV